MNTLKFRMVVFKLSFSASFIFGLASCMDSSAPTKVEKKEVVFDDTSKVILPATSPEVLALSDLGRTESKVMVQGGEVIAGPDLKEYIPLKITNSEVKVLSGVEIYYREEDGDDVSSRRVGKFKISLLPGKTKSIKLFDAFVVQRFRPIAYPAGEFHEPPFKCTKVYYADGTVRTFFGNYYRARKKQN